ncbi:MAG: hemin uptake protein HemP [Burkholderiales bacterium]|nr:hemin uptake protein HemP [Burkholderiales bacterium]
MNACSNPPAGQGATAVPTASLPSKPAAPIVSSHSLLAGRPELLIEHEQQIYRLRQTAQGKLILTK